MVIALAGQHPLCRQKDIMIVQLKGQPHLERRNCEFAQFGGNVFEEIGVSGPTVFASERDDWVLAMVAAGMGYGFLPETTAPFDGLEVRPLIEPEFWREINLVTVRGRPHSPVVGAFVREVMRTKWMGRPAISKRELLSRKLPETSGQ